MVTAVHRVLAWTKPRPSTNKNYNINFNRESLA